MIIKSGFKNKLFTSFKTSHPTFPPSEWTSSDFIIGCIILRAAITAVAAYKEYPYYIFKYFNA